MHLAQQALLSTVDQLLLGRGVDPDTISSEDKVALATQIVHLSMIHENEPASGSKRSPA